MSWKSLAISACIGLAGCSSIVNPDGLRPIAYKRSSGYEGTSQSHTGTVSQYIIVTTGLVAQPHAILGSIHVDTKGMISMGAVFNDALFRSPFAAGIQGSEKATIPEMNTALQEAAYEQYRDRVDAIINVSYHTDTNGNVSADGLAVQFQETVSNP